MKTSKFNDGVFEGERVVATTYEEMITGITAMGEAQRAAHLTWLEDAREEADRMLEYAKEKDIARVKELLRELENYHLAAYPEHAAFRIGMILQDARIRLGSKRLHVGRKMPAAARNGHEAVHGTAEVKAARWAAYAATYGEIKSRNPYMLHEDLCRKTAARHGVCLKTIKRHCPRK